MNRAYVQELPPHPVFSIHPSNWQLIKIISLAPLYMNVSDFAAGRGGGAGGQAGLPDAERGARQRREGAAAEAGGDPRLVRGH